MTSLLEQTRYERIGQVPHEPILVAQRWNTSLRNRLRTRFYRGFIVVAEQPLAGKLASVMRFCDAVTAPAICNDLS